MWSGAPQLLLGILKFSARQNGPRALLLSSPNTLAHSVRTFMVRRDLGPTIRERNRRRERIRVDEIIRHGREKVQRRSEFIEWNYSSELSAFSARIGETFDDAKLRQAFVNPSYAESELRRQRDLGITEEDSGSNSSSVGITTNKRLAEVGLKLTEEVLKQYSRFAFPFVPEEGIESFVKYLTSLEMLAEVSFLIGTRDLIMAEEYPPLRETYRCTLLAVIGALSESGKSGHRAARFVIDLVGSQLHCHDVNEMWQIDDPMRTLSGIMANEGRGQPEARLLWVSGQDTILACYHIGVYSDRELIGQAVGESAEIAEEMSARDALRRLFRTDEARTPIPLGDAELGSLERLKSQTNPTLSRWSQKVASKAIEG